MSLAKEIENLKNLKEKVNQLEENIIREIEETFIMQDYELQIREVKYPTSGWGDGDRCKIKILYPTLKLPNNYQKEEKLFNREFANCIIYEYELKQNDLIVKIREKTNFKDFKLKAGNYEIIAQGIQAVDELNYSIIINGKCFQLSKKIEIKDIWKKMLGNIEFKYNDFIDEYFSKKANDKSEYEYDELMHRYVMYPSFPTLQQMVKEEKKSVTFYLEKNKPIYARIETFKQKVYEKVAIEIKNSIYQNIFMIVELPIDQYKMQVEMFVKLTDDSLEKCGEISVFNYMDISKTILDKKFTLDDILRENLKN